MQQRLSDDASETRTSGEAPAPPAGEAGEFTLAILPDTQIYAAKYSQHFERQTEWIVKNTDRYNIRYVIHLGDITNDNSPEQWTNAERAMRTLDGVVPYVVLAGNHDHLGDGDPRRGTLLSRYFPVERCADWPTFGGVMEPGFMDNSFHTFEVAGEPFLILALEWAVRDEAVQWAQQVLDRHPEHRAILVTHAYLYDDGHRYDWPTFGPEQRWNPHSYDIAQHDAVNDGEQLWRKLVRPNPQFFLTLNGHVLGEGVARRCDPGDAGNLVHQMLVNYQMLEEGGMGFMRLLRFQSNGQMIDAWTYSPSLDQTRTDPANAFTLALDGA